MSHVHKPTGAGTLNRSSMIYTYRCACGCRGKVTREAIRNMCKESDSYLKIPNMIHWEDSDAPPMRIEVKDPKRKLRRIEDE